MSRDELVRRVLQVALPLVVVAAGIALEQHLESLREEPEAQPPREIVPVVDVVHPSVEDVQLVVHAQGVVRPRTSTTLVAEVDARVVALSPALADGGFFEAGEELLRLDDTDLVLRLEEARSRVAAAELALEQEQADAAVALRDWRSMHGGDQPPPLVARVPQLASRRAELAAARAAVEQAERNVARAVILAPYPGRVRERLVDVGTYVTRGRDLARVYAVDSAEVRLAVEDDDLAALDLPLGGEVPEPGPRVRLEADFAGGLHHWEGRIVRTSAALDERSRMVTLVAEVDDPYGLAREGDRPPLYSGLFVDAWIEGRTLAGAATLPREALQAGDQVFVLGPDERLEVRAVDVAHTERERVVLRHGVQPGERVVVSPLETPAAGMRLRVAEEGPR